MSASLEEAAAVVSNTDAARVQEQSKPSEPSKHVFTADILTVYMSLVKTFAGGATGGGINTQGHEETGSDHTADI